MPSNSTQPVASSSRAPPPATNTGSSAAAVPPGRRVVASRFLNNLGPKSSAASPRKDGSKRSFIIHGGAIAPRDGDWVNEADIKGKGRAGPDPFKGKTYEVASRFMLPPKNTTTTTGKTSRNFTAASTSNPTLSASASASSATRAGPSSVTGRQPTKPRSGPPPSRPPPVNRPLKPKTRTGPDQPPNPPSPGSVGTRSTARSAGTGSGTIARGTMRGGASSRGASATSVPLEGTAAGEPKKAWSWLDLAHSLGTVPISSATASNTTPLHAHAQGLFLLLASLKLTVVSEDRIMAGAQILKDAQATLAKAQEDVKEEVERERLTKEIELLNQLLEPKVGHRFIPLLFELQQAQRMYDRLLDDVGSSEPPSHHETLPVIKELTRRFADSISTLTSLPCSSSTPLADVLAQMVAQTRDKVAVLQQVRLVVEHSRDELRRKVWEESLRRGRDLGSGVRV